MFLTFHAINHIISCKSAPCVIMIEVYWFLEGNFSHFWRKIDLNLQKWRSTSGGPNDTCKIELKIKFIVFAESFDCRTGIKVFFQSMLLQCPSRVKFCFDQGRLFWYFFFTLKMLALTKKLCPQSCELRTTLLFI